MIYLVPVVVVLCADWCLQSDVVPNSRLHVQGYALDAARSAEARAALLADVGYQRALQTQKAWWYVKNALVFANVAVVGRENLDTALANAPESVLTGYFARLHRDEDEAADVARAMAMLYESMYDAGPLGPMWRRDWDEFSSLYIAERTAALTRMRARMDEEDVAEMRALAEQERQLIAKLKAAKAKKLAANARAAENNLKAQEMEAATVKAAARAMVGNGNGNAERTLGAEQLADSKDKTMQGKAAARDQLEGHLRSLKNQVQAAMV